MIPFEFYRLRLHLRAHGPLRFPAPAANLLRGALGLWLEGNERGQDYARWFRPGRVSETRPTPSGLADWPRPFLLRASHLDGMECRPGECWSFDVHIFAREAFRPLVRALTGAAEHGMGRGCVSSALASAEALDLDDNAAPLAGEGTPPPIRLNLADAGERASRVSLRFVTPTELKGRAFSAQEPDFATLFARLRDRLGNLGTLYGAGPLEVDFRGLGERARSVRLRHAQLHWERAERRSSRTGQVHPLGGFTGKADYEGDLGEFLPWLAAARWVGVGRQTVWGKGDVRVIR
ncbi:MAG: CRISPR system precrRNA processing endoribonuclease RAMP protein Cas6 [Bryobacteraceae bacterium]